MCSGAAERPRGVGRAADHRPRRDPGRGRRGAVRRRDGPAPSLGPLEVSGPTVGVWRAPPTTTATSATMSPICRRTPNAGGPRARRTVTRLVDLRAEEASVVVCTRTGTPILDSAIDARPRWTAVADDAVRLDVDPVLRIWTTEWARLARLRARGRAAGRGPRRLRPDAELSRSALGCGSAGGGSARMSSPSTTSARRKAVPEPAYEMPESSPRGCAARFDPRSPVRAHGVATQPAATRRHRAQLGADPRRTHVRIDRPRPVGRRHRDLRARRASATPASRPAGGHLAGAPARADAGPTPLPAPCSTSAAPRPIR